MAKCKLQNAHFHPHILLCSSWTFHPRNLSLVLFPTGHKDVQFIGRLVSYHPKDSQWRPVSINGQPRCLETDQNNLNV